MLGGFRGAMRIKIYMTEGAQGSEGGSVTLLVPEGHLGDLPSHPNGGTWSYLAVIENRGQELRATNGDLAAGDKSSRLLYQAYVGR